MIIGTKTAELSLLRQMADIRNSVFEKGRGEWGLQDGSGSYVQQRLEINIIRIQMTGCIIFIYPYQDTACNTR